MTTEQQIAAVSTAPRVTPADLEAEISSEHYFTADEGVLGAYKANNDVYQSIRHDDGIAETHLRLLTFCVLVLRNGFTVVGKSACASPQNFDAEIGRKVARADAVNQMWPLLGFRLKDLLAQPIYNPQWAAAEMEEAYRDSMLTGQGMVVMSSTGVKRVPNGGRALEPGETETRITFDALIQYGRDHGANVVDGMPWSFQYEGIPVSHETNDCYLVGPFAVKFRRGDVLVVEADASGNSRPTIKIEKAEHAPGSLNTTAPLRETQPFATSAPALDLSSDKPLAGACNLKGEGPCEGCQ